MYTVEDIQVNECLNYQLTELDERIFNETGYSIYNLDAVSGGITYKETLNPGFIGDTMITYLPERDTLRAYRWFMSESGEKEVETFDTVPYEELFREKAEEYNQMFLQWEI